MAEGDSAPPELGPGEKPPPSERQVPADLTCQEKVGGTYEIIVII